MKRTTPFQCFRKLGPEAHTHTANRRQERYRNDRKWARRYSGTENQATLRVYIVINLTVTAGDCWHIRTMSDFNKQKFNDIDSIPKIPEFSGSISVSADTQNFRDRYRYQPILRIFGIDIGIGRYSEFLGSDRIGSEKVVSIQL